MRTIMLYTRASSAYARPRTLAHANSCAQPHGPVGRLRVGRAPFFLIELRFWVSAGSRRRPRAYRHHPGARTHTHLMAPCLKPSFGRDRSAYPARPSTAHHWCSLPGRGPLVLITALLEAKQPKHQNGGRSHSRFKFV